MNLHARLLLSLVLMLPAVLSCGSFRYPGSVVKESYGERIDKGYLVIRVDSFRRKNQYYKQLNAVVRDSSGKMIACYTILDRCGCVSKMNYGQPFSRYKLQTNFSFDIPVSEGDKFIFKKFLDHPRITEFCTRSMLDSAKGFTRVPKKNKRPS